METKNRTPKVDSKAAACTNRDDALREAMLNLRPPRSKPTSSSVPAKPTHRPARKSSKGSKSADLETLESEPPTEMFTLKGQCSLKEMTFIELTLTGEHTRETAMDLAGYGNLSPGYKRLLASKIIQKYESSVGDHRKIMRAMGYGETKVLNLLIDSAVNAKSEMVRLNARTFLAKCLGMQQDVIDAVTGISIIVNSSTHRPGVESVPGDGGSAMGHTARPVAAAITILK
jgi:hypothetical protein